MHMAFIFHNERAFYKNEYDESTESLIINALSTYLFLMSCKDSRVLLTILK